MKNIYFSILILFFASSLHAQLRYGPEAGMNMSYTAINPTQGSPITTSMLIAYRAGGLLDVGISEKVGIQGGLYFSVLGYKYAYSQTVAAQASSYSFTDNATVTEYFLRLPVNVVFKKYMGPGRLFITVGPFLGYGLNGNVKGKYSISTTANGQTQSSDSNYKSSFTFKDDSGRSTALDYGICASIGYEIPMGFFIRAGYELSLAGVSAISGMGTQTNSCFTISLGYLFVHNFKNARFNLDSRNKYLPKPYNHLVFP